MLRRILLTVLSALSIAGNATAQEKDILNRALTEIGFTRSDLGYQPKGYWNRYPNPDLIPYKMPHFDDLFAEPLMGYQFTVSMGNVIEDYLDPKMMAEKQFSLHRLIYILGVDRRIGGFRNYSTNIHAEIDSTGPVIDALKKIFAYKDQQMQFYSFGNKADYDLVNEAEKQVSGLHPRIQIEAAKIMLNILDAVRWRDLALRNVRPELLQKVFSNLDFAESQGDGTIYFPEFDDVMKVIDEQSLCYGCMKAAQAAESGRWGLAELLKDKQINFANAKFDFDTPIGRIVISGNATDEHHYDDCCLLIDFGGDDTYNGSIAATSNPDIPVSICIDLDGKDKYICEDSLAPSQGAGIFGCGILIDVKGDDIYRSKKVSQGFGLLGIGILLDEEGDDDYKMESSGQGCGYFGCGFNLDVKGKDNYYIYGDGQGFGGVGGGVGILGNLEGDDNYIAEPSAQVVNRGDYHSEMKINVSNAQGVGAGRRGDGTDGHSWSGGLGAIIDIRGDDKYQSGNWSLGTGYWYGTGVVYDKSGNDLYRSVYFTQASGAHYSIGIMVDEAGNDRHELWETSGAALSFGWDYTNSLLVDKGGDDYYEGKIISIACAQIRSNSFLFDIGGNDTYRLGSDQQGMGAATYRDDYQFPDRYSAYTTLSKSVGILIDIGGDDKFLDWDIKTDKSEPSKRYMNDSQWFNPSKDDPNYGWNNFGVGIDVQEGIIPDLYFFKEKPKTGEGK
ncbi:MAG: hypothetical protein CO189_06810 [candidate division Zixibacteria bacterium CG_4_9_14_3_um_filter_46_8]|nr:MAG: hypothetical protein CO189_06810 [candidate division Zixibacteria bacterium CG_4_9_14_3_um_filter_46_8]